MSMSAMVYCLDYMLVMSKDVLGTEIVYDSKMLHDMVWICLVKEYRWMKGTCIRYAE